jgi:hypothetical protein
MMRVIFCSDPLRRSQPDSTFEAELRAAQAAGLKTSLISYEALVDEQDAEAAVWCVVLDGWRRRH